MKTVLFVDNGNIVLRSKERSLRDEPYHKLVVKSRKDTLDILQQKKVRIIVNDIRPPDMEGYELFRITGKRKLGYAR
jgi:DNA-binding NtrC family response regulator